MVLAQYVLEVPQGELNLGQTLSSGQAFRWSETEQGEWFGFLDGKPVRIRHEGDQLLVTGGPGVPGPPVVASYFDLSTPIRDILASFPADDVVLQAAVTAFPGLRVLRQDPWETLLSFILSSNKRIPHIRQCIEHLCTQFGSRLDSGDGDVPVHGWPTAAGLATADEKELRACALGYRAPFVSALARLVDSGGIDLRRPYTMEYGEAHEYLRRIPGVGPKVADCVLLFAFHHPGAFPVDVWIERVLRRYYLDGGSLHPSDKAAWIQSRFGPYAGYAQQYLFHWARCSMSSCA